MFHAPPYLVVRENPQNFVEKIDSGTLWTYHQQTAQHR